MIRKIRYNWHPGSASKMNLGLQLHPEGIHTCREVGIGGVTNIEFFDKTYCIVYYEDGHKEIQFNLNNIVFEGESNEKINQKSALKIRLARQLLLKFKLLSVVRRIMAGPRFVEKGLWESAVSRVIKKSTWN